MSFLTDTGQPGGRFPKPPCSKVAATGPREAAHCLVQASQRLAAQLAKEPRISGPRTFPVSLTRSLGTCCSWMWAQRTIVFLSSNEGVFESRVWREVMGRGTGWSCWARTSSTGLIAQEEPAWPLPDLSPHSERLIPLSVLLQAGGQHCALWTSSN